VLPNLTECLGRVEPSSPHGKLEALDLWLSSRLDSAICVGCVGDQRRCSLRAHGKTFHSTAITRGDAFAATWRAIGNVVRKAEEFERAHGAGVG
jgi:hypothetical protein